MPGQTPRRRSMKEEGVIDKKNSGKEKKAYEAPSFEGNEPLDHVSVYTFYYVYYYYYYY